MGSFCTLLVDYFEIDSSKNWVNPEVMTIFQESDRKIYETKVSEITHSIPFSLFNKILEDDIQGIEEEMDELTTQIEYIIPITNAIERLNVLGFTLNKAKEDFNIGIGNEISRIQNFIQKTKDGDFQNTLKKELDFLKLTSFEDWIYAFKKIFNENSQDLKNLPKPKNSTIEYILNKQGYEDLTHNYPLNMDFRFFLRAFLEACPKDSYLRYDLTDLINGGWFCLDDNICELSLNELVGDYPINSKTVILTEGSSDKFILEKSLELLYPHLSSYFSFMDFGLANIAGGAGNLVGNVKAFASASIENRIIALFDNDTAAHTAIRGLKKTTIPKNIKILHYPDLKLAKNYPTIGPNGISEMDINGLACSLELYFGEDILKQKDGLVPIQWKGYDESLKKYQGEILHKANLQKQFSDKLKLCKEDNSQIKKYDWEGIDLILQTIFNAFT